MESAEIDPSEIDDDEGDRDDDGDDAIERNPLLCSEFANEHYESILPNNVCFGKNGIYRSYCLNAWFRKVCHRPTTTYEFYRSRGSVGLGDFCSAPERCCLDTGLFAPVPDAEGNPTPAPAPGTPCPYDRDGRRYVCGDGDDRGRCVPALPGVVRHECINATDGAVQKRWDGPPCTADADCAAAAEQCGACPAGGERTFCTGGVCRRVCGVPQALPAQVTHVCGDPKGAESRGSCVRNGMTIGAYHTFDGPPCFSDRDCDVIVMPNCCTAPLDAPTAGAPPVDFVCVGAQGGDGSLPGRLNPKGYSKLVCRNNACRAVCRDPLRYPDDVRRELGEICPPTDCVEDDRGLVFCQNASCDEYAR